MRRRVLLSTIVAVIVAVLLLGIPLSLFGANWAMDNEQRALNTRLDRLVSSVQTAQELAREYEESVQDILHDRVLQRAVTGLPGDIPAYVTIVLPDGTSINAGEPVTGARISQGSQTDDRASVWLEISAWTARIRAIQVVVVVVFACLVAVGAGALVALWMSSRLSKPLVMLAATAEQLGSGQVKSQPKPSGIEEIDLVATELARTSDRLAGHLASARKFTADASHQMRTPLTALTMRLEEIELMSDDEEVREEARVSLDQVERLVSVIDDLLAASKHTQGGTTEPVFLADVARQQYEEWGPTFTRAGRSLEVDVDESVRVLATPGALAQVVSTILENSLKYGAGVTTMRSRPSATSQMIAFEIGDEGEGVSDEIAGRIFERGFTSGKGTGLGLALARDLVAADGGRVELAQKRPAVFAVFLAAVPATYIAGQVLPEGFTSSAPLIGPKPPRKGGEFGPS